MRITLPKVFTFLIGFSMLTFNLSGNNNPDENFCFNADLPEAQMNFEAMCLTAPIIICPPTYLGCPGDNLDPANTGVATAQPGDANCPMPVVSYTDSLVQSTGCVQIYHRTWKAEYPPGSASLKLHSSCQQTLYLEDSQVPTISNCPADMTVDLANNCDGTATWALPTANDDCGIQFFTTTHFSGASFPLGTTTVTYTATDFCGNSTTCSFNVTVVGSCCQAPMITCPFNLNVCPGSSTDPTATGSAIATPSDASCGVPTVTFNDSVAALAGCNGQNSAITRVWTAVDADSGASSSCTQTINVADLQNPVITNIPSDQIISVNGINCSAPVTWSEPLATDDCGLSSFTSTHASGTIFPQGSTLVTYTAVDNCGNQSTGAFQITIQCTGCNANPVITCPSNYTACPSSSVPMPVVAGSATAVPGSSLCGSPIVTFSDQVISTGNCAGTQTVQRTWTATEPSNSAFNATCIQLITLTDTQAPTIQSIPSDITVNGTGNGCSAVATWNQPFITDNCGVASSGSNFASGTAFSEGTTTVTYTAMDNCGNTNTASFTVTVICTASCTTPPSISCPSNYMACPTPGNPGPAVTGSAVATAGSAQCGNPIVTFSDAIISNGPCVNAKTINRTWTASDPANSALSTSCVQTITLQDNVAPSFISCPSSFVVSGTGTNCTVPVTWSNVMATDNCVTPSLSAVNQNGAFVVNGSSFAEGTHTITYTATDGCNNTATCSFSVTVSCAQGCTTAPTISCPADQAVCVNADTSPSLLGTATATGGPNCPAPIITYQDQVETGNSCTRAVLRVWKASYNNGSNLEATCIQNIAAVDNTAPVITNCPSDIVVSNANTAITWTAPSATDNCGSVTLNSNFNPGTVFPIGTTGVVYTAQDGCGNISTCSFTVAVNIPGSITCPSDIVVQCGNNGGSVVDWAPPVYEGTCSNCTNAEHIPGFIYMGTLNGNQYYCSLSNATWNDANAICQQNGGYLASINSAEENQFLANILTIQSAWIGLHRSNGSFEWSDGSPVNYNNWYPGQPNNYNGSQHCVEMLNNGQWNDQYCTYKLEFIMEKPCNNVNQISGPKPGEFLPGGTYEVVYEASDACGSNDRCSFTITVEGGISIHCPNDINTSAPANTNGIPVTWNAPTASSCCSNCSQSGQDIPGFMYMGSFGGHHYYCSLNPATWPAAQQHCQANGGHLAVINSAQENAFLANILTLQSAWIGCSDAASEGNFSWVNGDALNYTNWYPGQPNNYNNSQDYVEMLNNGQWNDQYNHFALEYIMELPGCINVEQIGGPVSGSVLAPGSSHTVTYRATDGCGNVETCSFDINVASIPVGNGYCTSGGENGNHYFIESIVFGALNSHSGSNGGYKDFTNAGCVTVQPNTSYPLILDPGFAGVAASKVYWKVWIDYNMDGDFTDSGEFIAYGCGNNVLSGTVTTPYTLWRGNTVMRIAMKPGGYPKSPCEVFPHGETEDYCIFVDTDNDITNTNDIEKRYNINDAVLLSAEQVDNNFEVFPNPVSEYLTINIENPDNVIEVSLFSIEGKVIRSLNNIDYSNTIEVADIQNGMYLLRIAEADGNVTTKKITINH